jgi:AcrR family transcriptional regulator
MLRESAQTPRILRAAAELFAEYGYHGVGVAQLEKAVGIQRGALYHHIGNKEALLYEISTSQLVVMAETAERIEREVADPEQRIRTLARAVMENIAAHRLEWTVHYRDFSALTGERLSHALDLRARYERVWTAALQSGVETGSFLPLADTVAAKGILGMFNYSYIWMDSEGRLSPHTIADLFCDVFLTGIRA